MKYSVLFSMLGASVALIGCDGDPVTDAGTTMVDSGPGMTDSGPGMVDSGPGMVDSGPGMVDAGPGGDTPTCAAYCDNAMTNCTGANAVYVDRAECEAICGGFGWPAGDPVTVSGPLTGNTIGCRTYHSGAPAGEEPATHCPHGGPTGANQCGTLCESYCTAALALCTGGDALYGDMAECMTACGNLDDTAPIGATDGDSVQCRLYHLGVAASGGDTATHCPHAGESGAGVCVGGWTFRTDDPATAYTRVDQAGMPALSTVLAATYTEMDEATRNAVKDLYNDTAPDIAGLIPAATVPNGVEANLIALHTVLSDDFFRLGLTTCAVYSTAPTATDQGVVMNVDKCLAQAGPLVVPDVISVDRAGAIGFPNGRQLIDPVIDVTLAVILLDLDVHAATTLFDVPVNPTANDVTFSTDFPYLAVPHTP